MRTNYWNGYQQHRQARFVSLTQLKKTPKKLRAHIVRNTINVGFALYHEHRRQLFFSVLGEPTGMGGGVETSITVI